MGQNSLLSLLLPALLACVAIAVAASFLPSGQPSGVQGWEIELSLEGRQPLVSGEPSTLRTISTCGPVSLSLDGEGIGASGVSSSLPLALAEGNHTFIAEGEGCKASLAVEVLPRECEGSQAASCFVGGCEGVRRCSGGMYSGCLLPRKVCVPGEKIGCSIDGCKFGHAECNACGSGFGECLPAAGDSKNGGNSCASGAACN